MTGVLIAGLFGHRHADDPIWVAALHAVAQWIGTHWAAIAVIVPVLGLIVAGIVNHYLALAREKRARRVMRDDVRARVHADLAARLLSHCSYIQTAIGDRDADPSAWRPGNTALRRRAEMPDAIEALGGDYVGFMAAIESERRTVDALVRLGIQTRDRLSERIGAGASDIIETYVPFICDFGEAQQARRLSRFAGGVRGRRG